MTQELILGDEESTCSNSLLESNVGPSYELFLITTVVSRWSYCIEKPHQGRPNLTKERDEKPNQQGLHIFTPDRVTTQTFACETKVSVAIAVEGYVLTHNDKHSVDTDFCLSTDSQRKIQV
jgi:hypothetical protein